MVHDHRAELVVKELRTLPPSRRRDILRELQNLEKKAFPANEAFSFTEDLMSKQNYHVLVVQPAHAPETSVVAYAVCAGWNHRLLLHKICVSPAFRGQGIGHHLLEAVAERARRSGCRGIDLWVDESRHVARALYAKHNFKEHDLVPEYYGPCRNGIKMVLDLK